MIIPLAVGRSRGREEQKNDMLAAASWPVGCGGAGQRTAGPRAAASPSASKQSAQQPSADLAKSFDDVKTGIDM